MGTYASSIRCQSHDLLVRVYEAQSSSRIAYRHVTEGIRAQSSQPSPQLAGRPLTIITDNIMHPLRALAAALALTYSAMAQSCYSNQGTCKYTSACKAPAYYPKPGYCPGPADYQCCIPTGCVVCKADEERDLEARKPCC